MNQAHFRAKRSARTLTDLLKSGVTLSIAASAVIEADELLSAVSEIYDALYDVNQDNGIIGRRIANPISPRTATRIKAGV